MATRSQPRLPRTAPEIVQISRTLKRKSAFVTMPEEHHSLQRLEVSAPTTLPQLTSGLAPAGRLLVPFLQEKRALRGPPMEVGFRQGPGKPVLVDDLRKLKFALTQENKKEKGVWLQDPKVDSREHKVQRDRQRVKEHKSNLMPEVCRALQGWKRLHPTGARMPLPMPAVCGLACEMVRRGKTTMGWLTMAAADMYLRPGEAIALTEDMIIAPRTQLGSAYRTTSVLLHPWSHGRASKAGQFDDSVLLDSRDRPWMGDLMLSWKRSKAPRQQLATFTMSEWGAEFKQCCEILGLPPCHLYVLRHSGPSDDFLRNNRSMTQIKRRGRWSQDQTVRKYEKAARSLAQMSQWPVSLLDHLQFCEKHVADILNLRRVASIYQGPIPRGRVTGARKR